MAMQRLVVVFLVGLVAVSQGDDTETCVAALTDGCDQVCSGDASSTTTVTTTNTAATSSTTATTTAPTTTPAATSKAGNRNQRDVVQFATTVCGDRNETDCCVTSGCMWQTCNSGDQPRAALIVSLIMAVLTALIAVL